MSRQVQIGLLVGGLIIVALWAGTRLYARHIARVKAAVAAMTAQ